jgi:hypothetical protein
MREPGLLNEPSVHLAEREAALSVLRDPVAVTIVERLLLIRIVLELDGLEATAAREDKQKGGKKKQVRFHEAEDAPSFSRSKSTNWLDEIRSCSCRSEGLTGQPHAVSIGAL